MTDVTIMGIDLAKNYFHVHGEDSQGRCVLRKRLRRGQVLEHTAQLKPCVIGLEACGGAHFWGRAFQAQGHRVRMLSPQYVKPYVKRNKHDAADAEACCEAAQRPGMRFVPVKSADQQAMALLHRVRDQLIGQRRAQAAPR